MFLGVKRLASETIVGEEHGVYVGHSEECRDRVQDILTTDLERQIGTREQDVTRTDCLKVGSVYVGTMGTVQVGGSFGSSVGMAQSSSACAAQPPDKMPSKRATETTTESSVQQSGGFELVDDQGPAESQGAQHFRLFMSSRSGGSRDARGRLCVGLPRGAGPS